VLLLPGYLLSIALFPEDMISGKAGCGKHWRGYLLALL
jgi:hypothetical protein